MASKSNVDPERILEKEHVVQEGMDISGHWNRMFEQRVIWDYTPELLDKVREVPGGESFGYCYQCAQCIPVCPVNTVGDITHAIRCLNVAFRTPITSKRISFSQDGCSDCGVVFET